MACASCGASFHLMRKCRAGSVYPPPLFSTGCGGPPRPYTTNPAAWRQGGVAPPGGGTAPPWAPSRGELLPPEPGAAHCYDFFAGAAEADFLAGSFSAGGSSCLVSFLA